MLFSDLTDVLDFEQPIVVYDDVEEVFNAKVRDLNYWFMTKYSGFGVYQIYLLDEVQPKKIFILLRKVI